MDGIEIIRDVINKTFEIVDGVEEESTQAEGKEDADISDVKIQSVESCSKEIIDELAVKSLPDDSLDITKHEAEEEKKEGSDETSVAETSVECKEGSNESPAKDKSTDDTIMLVDDNSKSFNVESEGKVDNNMDFTSLLPDNDGVEEDTLADSRPKDDEENKTEVESTKPESPDASTATDSNTAKSSSSSSNTGSKETEAHGLLEEVQETVTPSEDDDNPVARKSATKSKDKKKKSIQNCDGDEIVELPVQKKPAVVVDLSDEEDADDKDIKQSEGGSEESSSDGNKRIKLRSLASLVDVGTEDNSGNTPVPGVLPDHPAIGEIVEHGVIIGSDEMDGLQLRISNVVGGEDCITGLTMDEDRDSFSCIQISSVTTLIDPMSPEDPNKDNDTSAKPDESEKSTTEAAGKGGSEKTAAADSEKTSGDSTSKGIQIVHTENLASKDDANKPSESTELQEAPKDSATSEESQKVPTCVYHILRSILTVHRECLVCGKRTQCEFRITKKGEPGTWAFLCTTECRSSWTGSLPADHQIEKPRLIFEKLCGMCGKDLSSGSRSGQFSWETREFCSRKCLNVHLKEVAGECHMCREEVRPMFIGKYCVRFGSDIHQFCSNGCLERYKTKIRVCCYCQKNLDKVERVSSITNKEYCSMKCLKRAQRRDIGQQNYTEQHPCTVCMANGVNKYEFLSNQENFQLCSDPCLNVYKYANRVKAVSCCLCFRVMNAEDVGHYLYHGGHQLRVFCSDSCVNVFILSARKIVVCSCCKVKKYNFDMVHRQVDEDFRDYFYCSLNCLNTKEPVLGSSTKNNSEVSSSSTSVTTTTANETRQSESSDPMITLCNMCEKMAKPQYHMVMSDNTLRSFCRYSCAHKYKSTFGFQINGIQNSDSSQSNNSVAVLRSKNTQAVTENVDNTSKSKKIAVNDVTQNAAAATAELLKLLTPPVMVNKITSCRPATLTKGVYCKPHPWHRSTQTDFENDVKKADAPPVIPVPVPVYVPAPMMMYNSPFPVPLIVPVPVPVPIFIPTTAKSVDDLKERMKKIQEEIPADPYEAEMLLLARASSENVGNEQGNEKEQQNQDKTEPTNTVTDEAGTGAVNDAGGDDMQCVNISCLDTVEDDLPRYPLRLTNNGGEGFSGCVEEGESHNNKRRATASPMSAPASKKCRNNTDDLNSWYDQDDRQSDPDDVPVREDQHSDHDFNPDTDDHPALTLDQATECEADPEPYIEEFQGPFLNKMYGLAAWKKWVTEKNEELLGVSSSRSMKLFSEDIMTMNCEELNYGLCLFLKDLRKPNGEMYQPDTVFYMLLGIQQHLFDSSRTDCIFMDFGFEKFTNCFDEITKTFYRQSQSPGGDRLRIEAGVTRVTETMLWECRQLGAHTPQVLLNTLFYFNTKVFKLKTVEAHQALCFSNIVKQWRRSNVGQDSSVTRTILLKYYPKKSAGDSKLKKPFEMHENRDDPLRCPVKLYEFYLSKCPEGVRSQRDIYYVYPERSCVPDSPTWFSTQTVQANNLSKMLNRALMVREVQEALGE
ncbi:hypothetical protein Pcinc_013583 [Petrolisthes cinctipes]|uniref:TRASH domain-containing protein n=1 Tax=Petrolisthes cinctipes TaxID=88211 RepID=A0AAE1FWL6_PETCI|nr:hypothetical protein Pcinc_013583 [Petrolisthes cinctipes]